MDDQARPDAAADGSRVRLGNRRLLLLPSSFFFFFFYVTRARRWLEVSFGFVGITLFATLIGIATIIHWDRATTWVYVGGTVALVALMGWLLLTMSFRRAAAAPTSPVPGS